MTAPRTDVAREEVRLRKWIKLTATTTLIGIALTVSESQTLGGVITAGSTVALIWTLHRFGRLGPDAGPGSGLAA